MALGDVNSRPLQSNDDARERWDGPGIMVQRHTAHHGFTDILATHPHMHLIYYVHHHYAFTYAQSLIHVALTYGVNGRASQPQPGAAGDATRMWTHFVNPYPPLHVNYP